MDTFQLRRLTKWLTSCKIQVTVYRVMCYIAEMCPLSYLKLTLQGLIYVEVQNLLVKWWFNNKCVHVLLFLRNSDFSARSWRRQNLLSSHLCLGLHTGLFPSSLPTKTLYVPLLFPPVCHKSTPSHSSWFDHSNNICSEIRITKVLIIQSSPVSCYLISLRPKYIPQDYILR